MQNYKFMEVLIGCKHLFDILKLKTGFKNAFHGKQLKKIIKLIFTLR